MGLTLEKVVPWGRSLSEYQRMFALTPADLQRRIIDCGGGPASFNAEMTEQGYSVVSCDPIYQFSAAAIAQRIDETYPIILSGVAANLDSYCWQDITNPTQLGEVRMAAMRQFLADFSTEFTAGRYCAAALPTLPFPDKAFDLALCSHLLFTYSDQLSLEFHRAAITEMCRVAQEVRIFPLLKISGEPSPHLPILQRELIQQGYSAIAQPVPYEFQKNGNQLLQIQPNF
ncbi:MAG: SAM-dependent methyltransferase [Leptolyngbya sp.]|nr:MAG: SAM-dependent methyltransferase [Leptolyngbya sp.]